MSPPSNVPRVLIVAGEASGDLYGGLLMRAMREGSSAEFAGIGGASMRAAGLRPVADASALGVTGLFEVAARFASIWKAYRACGRMLASQEARPDLAILIDYPDFNLRLAKRARRAGVPVLYFISPQVWAWRKGRLKGMPGLVNRMLVILPFEEPLYREAGVPVEFVGHPLLDLVRAERTPRQTRALLGLDAQAPVVALLPGSRRNELLAHVPPMMEAARILKAEFRDLQFLMTIAPTFNRREVETLVRAHTTPTGPKPVLVTDDRYDAVAASDAAIVASGTATLETALLQVPMVVIYRMNRLSYAVARHVMRLPNIGMPNLIAGRRVVPELVQDACAGAPIAAAVRTLLTDRGLAEKMRSDLAEVRGRLGRPGAIGRAAAAAWSMIRAARDARVA